MLCVQVQPGSIKGLGPSHKCHKCAPSFNYPCNPYYELDGTMGHLCHSSLHCCPQLCPILTLGWLPVVKPILKFKLNWIELKIVTSLLLSPSDSGLSSKCRAISACSTLVEVVEVNSSFKDVNRLWSPLKNNGAKFRCLSKLLNLHILGKWKTAFHCPRTFRLVTLSVSWSDMQHF